MSQRGLDAPAVSSAPGTAARTAEHTLILGIETSCDETAAAVVADGRVVRASQVASSAALQSRYGGVVPELAARQHVRALPLVVAAALDEAGVVPAALTAIAVTQGPGLLGSLLLGLTAAKALALAWGKPLWAVNHLEAHLHANAVAGPLQFPSLALLVSGGHTGLFWWEGPGRMRRLAETRDDAAGEAFDKGARVLGLEYPGGPAVERVAAAAIPPWPPLPVARMGDGTLDFSFSGLKSALQRAVAAEPVLAEADQARWAAALQDAVAAQITDRLTRAWQAAPARHVYAAGGVVANRALRARLDAWARERGVGLHVPPVALCTDNAVMVAAAAAAHGPRARIGLEASPRIPWELASGPVDPHR
ncbi:MAG: tRNA (adenosine(37)-N6)-threonylcarbamoyltransferase complex transferase subunit TsaD [Thermaerobacter sp.]|nr:tRNA (adenosine(37)-N6)-threonylcarbamoyltransferase complex transferase subunit TsaD [Thermaerobacter sp.]